MGEEITKKYTLWHLNNPKTAEWTEEYNNYICLIKKMQLGELEMAQSLKTR